jgi:ferritin-like metal-binding protein YciE
MSDTTSTSERHTVATYISDILALEQHMKAPLDAQIASEAHQKSSASPIFSKIQATTTEHIAALQAALEAAGGSPAAGVKSAWATLLGGGAAALNNVRATKVSKSLRDDYTALGLAAISYTMLHATAAGLGDTKTAELAKKHLDEITPIIVDISTVIPGVVLEELAADGEPVKITAAELTQQVSKNAWSAENVRN